MRLAIDALGTEPRPFGAKQLKDRAGRRALRIGDWRIVYLVDEDHQIVNVEIIAPRGQVYRRL
jgi:mRNA-degrading endonuclease RelE of RelBE toxin-antitoxin system